MTISDLQDQLRVHEESHRTKDITIADLERAHSDKESLIRGHLLNIDQLGNKLSLLEQAGFSKDGVIQEHINSHSQKDNVIRGKEGNINFLL